jgi:hypothetical protein
MDGNIAELFQIGYLQAEISQLYMKKHNLTPIEFVEEDKKYDILRFLELGYYPFHLTGSQGVLNEVEDYVASQRNQLFCPKSLRHSR